MIYDKVPESPTPAMLAAAERIDWQPIATAPAKTWILTWGDWQDPPVGVSRYDDLTRVVERVEHESRNAKGRRRVVQEEDVQEREWEGHHWGPTYWMPLPSGPHEGAAC
jgi:hypothetical protein